jgi:hypothetical protein
MFNRLGTVGTVFTTSVLVASCGGNGGTVAQISHAFLSGSAPGSTPFSASVDIQGVPLKFAQSATFLVHPGATDVSKPLTVTSTMAYLADRGYVSGGDQSGTIHLPIFGLYANQSNTVDITVTYTDGSTDVLTATITTPPYVDPHGVFDHLAVVQARTAASPLGLDYFYIKTSIGSPTIVDTDGHVRWQDSNPFGSSNSSIYADGGFIVGSPASADLEFLALDGTQSASFPLTPPDGAMEFDHDIEPGRDGWIANSESVIAVEFDAQGNTLHAWNFQQIIADYMNANGDDAAQFVRPGVDWFHLNTAIYDPSDNTLIASSRENFVIKVDYDSGQIIWIMGDPTKYWATFPSLLAKALTFTGLSEVPIGQHSIGFAPDGSLLLFNDGTPSVNQPPGAPVGQARAMSLVSDYVIDPASATVNNVWNYDHSPELLSSFCSSARAVSDGSVLVDYAIADNATMTHLVGLDPQRNVAFEFTLPTGGACVTAWYAAPISMEALSLE